MCSTFVSLLHLNRNAGKMPHSSSHKLLIISLLNCKHTFTLRTFDFCGLACFMMVDNEDPDQLCAHACKVDLDLRYPHVIDGLFSQLVPVFHLEN